MLIVITSANIIGFFVSLWYCLILGDLILYTDKTTAGPTIMQDRRRFIYYVESTFSRFLCRSECCGGQNGLHILQLEQFHRIVGAAFQRTNGEAKIDIIHFCDAA